MEYERGQEREGFARLQLLVGVIGHRSEDEERRTEWTGYLGSPCVRWNLLNARKKNMNPLTSGL